MRVFRTFSAATSLALTTAVAVPAVGGTAPMVGPGSGRDDQVLAKHAMLKLADFPSGWREQKSSSSKAADKTFARVSECKSYVKQRALARRLPRANSPKFVRQDAQVMNGIGVFPTTKDAERFLSVAADPRTATCLGVWLKKQIVSSFAKHPSARIDNVDVSVGQLPVDPVGDETTAYAAVITVSRAGQSQRIYADLQVVRVGRADAYFSFQNSLGPPNDLRSSLIDAVVGRLGTGNS